VARVGSGVLLIYAPVPLYLIGTDYWLEDQACNGLVQWSMNFARVIVMMPVESGKPPRNWIPVMKAGIDLARVELVPLPTAYRPDQFIRAWFPTRRLIRQKIQQAEFLSFAIGGLFGDWGSVASWEAHCMGRKFAVWTDRVESLVVKNDAFHASSWRKRLRSRLTHAPMAALERFIIRRATVGLFHGAETYATYAQYARASEVVHDIHLKEGDRISEIQLGQKVEMAGAGPLRICYVGRVDAMKGPHDWLEVMRNLRDQGVEFCADWFGDGEHLTEMRLKTEELGLSDMVKWHGFVRDRVLILDQLRRAQLFVFCHKTPESPRNLVEALVSGTPIAGYKGLYARDLVSASGGGLLTPANDPLALSLGISVVAKDRAALKVLIQCAAKDGLPHNDQHVFAHRSSVLKRYLTWS
jgi:colanic acid/amylovoran biosynthesis glycosyltransferase